MLSIRENFKLIEFRYKEIQQLYFKINRINKIQLEKL